MSVAVENFSAALPADESDVIPSVATPELVTDAEGLIRLHTEAHGRAELNDDGSGTLTHEDDPTFRFVVGHFEDGVFIKLGTNGVHALVYAISGSKVYQHVGYGESLSPGIDITDKSIEIAAVGNLLQKGK